MKKIPTHYALTLLTLLCSLTATAQSPAARHFTTKDGLVSNMTYDIMQDSKG